MQKNELLENNSNVITNQAVLERLREVKSGYYPSYRDLGKIYEKGIGIKKDLEKAVKFYEEFHKAYNINRVRINEIDFLVNLGNLYFEIGNKKKAAEKYFLAGMEILYPNHYQDPEKLLKQYKIKELIDKTGCANYF
jgi:TPR repeat protein